MVKKNSTLRITLPVKTEPRCKKWSGRIWQRIRIALGILLVQPEPSHALENLPAVASLAYQELYNIATCNKFRREDTEITIAIREISSNETVATLILLHRKQPVCRAVLQTTWSSDGVVTQVSASADLIVLLSASRHSICSAF